MFRVTVGNTGGGKSVPWFQWVILMGGESVPSYSG